jgi:hypothetical protein
MDKISTHDFVMLITVGYIFFFIGALLIAYIKDKIE